MTRTTGPTQATFNYVRDNPGVTRSDAARALEKLGVKPSSSTSLLSIMLTRGNLRRAENGGLFATQTEYEPVPKSKPTSVKKSAPPAPPPAVVTPTPPKWTVDSVIDNLNIRQAQAVYMELHGIFGVGK